MDIRGYNRSAWDTQVEKGNEWTVPVSAEVIARAREGDWSVLLTPTRPVPREWFPDLDGLSVLCLASGGGQQAPTLAAAGARVVCFDNSPRQLAQDRRVADRESLTIETVEGDMADLSALESDRFDLVFHPCSNTFVPDVRPVWREAFRVLRGGGFLLAGFCNPVLFIFDDELQEKGEFQVRHRIPYSDLDLPEEERRYYTDRNEPLCFAHTLEDQIAGQTDAGFHITALYEDRDDKVPITRFIPAFMATRALKPER